MASPLPPDPYKALGVARDATAAAIKTAHRKLVLKCHPDKVIDPKEKQAASDQFHKIQSAYEILIDEGRRERYDAQVRLADLRQEAMARQPEGRPRGADIRSTSYRTEPVRSAYTSRGERVVPQYEERRPPYATDYFDAQPRATPRKEPEYAERTSSRRTETKEKPRASTRSSKESEKERRKEKLRQAERESRKERERKREPYVEDDSGSDSDEYDWRARRVREDEDARRPREAYQEPASRLPKDPQDAYHDDRARKMASHTADARDYIMSSRGARPRTEERRPSPARVGSSRDRVQYIKRDDGRPAYMMRRGSEKPAKEAKDEKKKEKESSSRKTSTLTPERRSSAENVDQRKPPPLNTSKSSPADIHIASEKPRAASLQPNSAAMPPPVKRSDTMPYNSSSRRGENVLPKSSRATEFAHGEPTPATTPENQMPPPQGKFPHGRQPYADDTATHQQERARPAYLRRTTRSPSPMKEATRETLREHATRSREAPYDAMPRSREPAREAPSRDPVSRSRESREPAQSMREEPHREFRDPRDPRSSAHRTASTRYSERPQPPPTARTTSYVYTPSGVEPVGARAREPSPRGAGMFYGDSPNARSPHPRATDEGIRFAKPIRPENIKVQSGYSPIRPSGERPQVSRSNSNSVYRQQPVRA